MNIEHFGLVPHASKTVTVGARFGRCVVLGTGKEPGTYLYRAVCRCDCGTVFAPMCAGLRNQTTQSCGCKNREDTTKHGLWRTPIYITWSRMMSRCYKPQDPKFHDYGGRGITVCDRWHDITSFHADMAPSFVQGLTLDRTDNSRGYSRDNCEWRTPAQQARNKRNNIWITIDGDTKILKDWCAVFGVSYGMVRTRIKDKGWDPVLALKAPAMPRIHLSLRGDLC